MYQPSRNVNIFPEKGSSFFLFSSSDYHEKEYMHKKTAANSEPLRVLLADDDVDDRELFAEAIEESGAKVKLDFAEDGDQLLQKLENISQLPHLIFLDLNMPNKNGKECLAEIRRNEKLKDIPVIIYSTSSSDFDINETFEKGANLYISKPYSFKELVKIARQVLTIDWEYRKPGHSRAKFVFSLKKKL